MSLRCFPANTMQGGQSRSYFCMVVVGGYMARKPRFRNVGAGKGIKAQLDAATLEDLYVHRSLTQAEIARHFGCSPQFISQLVHEYGFSRSPRAE